MSRHAVLVRNPPVRALVLLLAAACVLGGCGGGPGVLYHDEQPPRLKNGTVTMRTTWTPSDEANPDVRRIKCRDGKITCELISRSRGHWTGEVPVVGWEKLWATLLQARPLAKQPTYDVVPDDPQSQGPYHLISIELDGVFHEFSAQLRRNILGVFSSKEMADRLRYSDAIAECVQAYATHELKPPEPDRPPLNRPKGEDERD